VRGVSWAIGEGARHRFHPRFWILRRSPRLDRAPRRPGRDPRRPPYAGTRFEHGAFPGPQPERCGPDGADPGVAAGMDFAPGIVRARSSSGGDGRAEPRSQVGIQPLTVKAVWLLSVCLRSTNPVAAQSAFEPLRPPSPGQDQGPGLRVAMKLICSGVAKLAGADSGLLPFFPVFHRRHHHHSPLADGGEAVGQRNRAKSADSIAALDWRGLPGPCRRGGSEERAGLGAQAWTGGQGGSGPGLARGVLSFIGPLRMPRFTICPSGGQPACPDPVRQPQRWGGESGCKRLTGGLPDPAPSFRVIPTWEGHLSRR